MANSALIGVKDLNRKLERLDRAMAIKTLRGALFKSTTPVVRLMKARIPTGSRLHRTYRKRLVSPGFSKRSIKRLTGKKFIYQGKLSIAIGTKAEAFYAIRFLDQGPHTITKRRQQTNRKARGHVGYRRRSTSIKPYTLKRRPWFESTFIASKNQMVGSFRNELETLVKKAVR